MLQKISSIIRAISFWILPRKLHNKIYVEKHLLYKNPLYRHQKYQYRNCGCGSGKKVKWCCGKGKWIAYAQYKQFKSGLEAWDKIG